MVSFDVVVVHEIRSLKIFHVQADTFSEAERKALELAMKKGHNGFTVPREIYKVDSIDISSNKTIVSSQEKEL